MLNSQDKKLTKVGGADLTGQGIDKVCGADLTGQGIDKSRWC